MCSYTLSCGLELTSIAEADTQQTFMDILDKDVIEPLTMLKVRQDHIFCGEIPNEGLSGRKEQLGQESGLSKFSQNPPRHILILQRTQSRGSSRHI